jgi:hypothetical protein
MKRVLLAAAAIVALSGAAHAEGILPFGKDAVLNQIKSPADFTQAYNQTLIDSNEPSLGAHAAPVTVARRNYCEPGYCAVETVLSTWGEPERWVYTITTKTDEYHSYCDTMFSGKGDRECYTERGGVWLDHPDGRGGWTTVERLRERF